MAEDTDPESRTEDPTPRRREEARRQGQIPFSAEMVGGVVLLAGVLGLSNMGASIGGGMLAVFRSDLLTIPHHELGPTAAQELFLRTLVRMLTVLGPLMALIFAVAIVASVVQVGFQISPERLEFKFDRLNPATGFGRLFSTSALVKGGLAVLRVIALGAVAYLVLRRQAGVVASISQARLLEATAVGWALTMRLAVYLSAVMAGIAVIDYFHQRRKFEQSLRMTKQEVKEELKHEEGDPQIKARMRQLGRERARRKMMAEVPKATVVITNPTHFAVALRYDQGKDEAPVVVGRGTGLIARRIAEVARKHSVPVVERPPLARALYGGVKEGQPIPGPLFQAVAEVIAFVYRLRGAQT